MDSKYKAELVKTTNSMGWRIAMDLCDQVVKAAEEAVWACTDRGQRDDLVLKAQATREAFATWKRLVEDTKQVVTETSPDDDFLEVSM